MPTSYDCSGKGPARRTGMLEVALSLRRPWDIQSGFQAPLPVALKVFGFVAGVPAVTPRRSLILPGTPKHSRLVALGGELSPGLTAGVEEWAGHWQILATGHMRG